VGFIPMLSDVVPEKQRAAVFSTRNIVYNLALSICVFMFGIWLEQVAFPKNYTVMYLFGFSCTILSLAYLIKVVVPDSTSLQSNMLSGIRDQRQNIRSQLIRNQPFIRITINTIMHGMGMWAVLPLYVLYYVRDLGAEEAWLGLNSTVGSISMIIGFALWRVLIARWGDYPTVKRTIVLVGLYPIAVALLGSLPLILIATALNGLITPGVNLSHFNTLLKATPEENRPGYTAIYMTIANLGIFIGPLIGVALGDRLGLAPALIICGLASVIGSTSFWWWPVYHETKRLGNIVV
jgi:predicted MFS family arabinose efflux permease